MAQDKKSFLVYCDLIHTIKKMKKEDAGELFLHLLEYTNDLNPTTENMVVELVFEPIKQQLKRDLKAYEKSIEDKSLNGRLGNLKRWNKDLYLQVESKEISIKDAETIAVSRKTSLGDKESRNPTKPIANIAVIDTVNVTDNVNVINKNNLNPINWDALLKFFNATTNKKCRVVSTKAKNQFNARLKDGFTKEDIFKAIKNCYSDDWHIKNNHQYLTLEFISRADKLDKFSQIETINTSSTTNQKAMKYDD